MIVQNTRTGERVENVTLRTAADGVQHWECQGSLFFTNNLPYILRLEYGHSKKQAPLGWVRDTVSRFQKMVDSVVREVAQ